MKKIRTVPTYECEHSVAIVAKLKDTIRVHYFKDKHILV